MLLRSVTRNKLLLAALFLACVFIVRQTISIKDYDNKVAQKNTRNKTLETKTTTITTTTIRPWILPSRQVRLWMDIPNAFPWRHCIEEYNNIVTLLTCYKGRKSQIFSLEPVGSAENVEKLFTWRTATGACIKPGKAMHENKMKRTLVVSSNCSTTGHWKWTSHGQITWSEGCSKCVTSTKANLPLAFEFCKELSEDQNIEMGEYHTDNGSHVLRPLEVTAWQERQNAMRTSQLSEYKVLVTRALKEIDEDDLLHMGGFRGEKRRAAVFYMDKGRGAIPSIKWWLYAWQFIGLNSSEEAFDIVVMVHPESVKNIPDTCREVEDGFIPSYGKPGECLYKVYVGITYRDNSFDSYMNSQECLFGPGSEFLSHYQVLLRADMDTFPTPRLLGFWPEGVIVDKGYGTMMGKESIKEALRQLACAAGINHQEWFNIGSSWYGDGRRVRNLAKLTVALNKFGRAHMFGPGTLCRCAECVGIPKECEWGGGPYAGVLLLYLQEIAINKILTPEEWSTLPPGVLDQGVTDTKRSVCQPGVLHCMHNAEPFSKFAFAMGKYSDWDMAELDITVIRDYAMFMALSSNNQGKNGQGALDSFNKKKENLTWPEYCKDKT